MHLPFTPVFQHRPHSACGTRGRISGIGAATFGRFFDPNGRPRLIATSKPILSRRLKQLQDAGAKDAGDFFFYRIGEAMMDLDGAPYGGSRYPVESIMAGRTFVKFHLDVGVGDVVLDPPEQARMRDWLGFAGIGPPDVPMIQREQQFAKKLHAYTLPRTTPNSGVRDLVDMVLLIQSGTLESGRVGQALDATFGRRAAHSIPEAFTPPPEEWSAPFARLAAECRLDLTAAEAFSVL